MSKKYCSAEEEAEETLTSLRKLNSPHYLLKLSVPIIKKCVAHLECRLFERITAGDHSLFIGEILAAYADENAFTDKYDLEKTKLIFHVGGNEFTLLVPEVVTPPLDPKT